MLVLVLQEDLEPQQLQLVVGPSLEALRSEAVVGRLAQVVSVLARVLNHPVELVLLHPGLELARQQIVPNRPIGQIVPSVAAVAAVLTPSAVEIQVSSVVAAKLPVCVSRVGPIVCQFGIFFLYRLHLPSRSGWRAW